MRGKRGRSLAKGSYRVTATLAGAARVGAQLQGVSDCRLGVLAFGDSITNGGGELQWGVALQSWALWVARGLGAAVHRPTRSTARARRRRDAQVPAFEPRTRTRTARYDLGCLYAGVNDVRAPDWDADAFARRLRGRARRAGGALRPAAAW